MEHYTLSGYKYAFSYDANGNRTAMQILLNDTPTGYVKEYEWNEDDRLTRVTASLWGTPLKTVKYQYCRTCGGQRTGRIEYDEAEMIVEWLRYEMDALNHLRIDEVYDADSNGELEDPSATGDAWRVQRVYINGPGQLGQIAKVIVFTYASATTNTVASEEVYYYHYDILGNVSVISDPNGDEADQFEQDAFGNLVSGTWSGRIGGITEQITTKQYDADLGLYYFNARWYDPVGAAFVSVDRMFMEKPYTFCRANPLAYLDPTGDATIHNQSSDTLLVIVRDSYEEARLNNDDQWKHIYWNDPRQFNRVVSVPPGKKIGPCDYTTTHIFDGVKDSWLRGDTICFRKDCFDVEGFYPSYRLRTNTYYYFKCAGRSTCSVTDQLAHGPLMPPLYVTGSAAGMPCDTFPIPRGYTGWVTYDALRWTGGYPSPDGFVPPQPELESLSVGVSILETQRRNTHA